MNFPGLMAKVKALSSKILTSQEIDELLNTSTLEELFKKLNNTGKLNINTGDKLENLHRRDVEILLKDKMLDDFYNIYFYLPPEGKKFFKFMEKRFEVENIKYAFRILHAQSSFNENNFFPLRHFEIDVKSVIKCKSVDELLNILKNSAYYDPIQTVYSNYKKENRIEIILNSLDFWYFMKMKSLLKTLSSYASGMKKIFNVQVDITNVEWIYRSRILFNINVQETLNYILPIEGKLTKNYISRLASSKNLDEFLSNLKASPYSEYFTKVSKEYFSYVIQKISYRILLDHAYMLLARTDNGLDVLGGYLYLREYEYMDLVSIVESKRYSVSKDRAKNLLILWR
jgi:V/A-type H+-transporting ATPase subunit C